jgi:hypothetical protein
VQERGLTVFGLWAPGAPGFGVDIFASEPFDYADIDSRATVVVIGSAKVRVIGRADLIAMKRAVGRPLDLDDARQPEALDEVHD